ncbi:unnamed protein product [Miscanthus lutarioriparius]|uniref:MATH domain-containing protein n=1 Tax=Miscanthus lutarioriparius TaxID=422564 RepID=A0A811R415_9POAL|nr:unnamed protein product [Miscanthus lutarioriparius]
MLDYSYFTHQFKLGYWETENVAIGHKVCSEDILAGGHLWRIECYPRGKRKEENGEWLSIFLHHVSESRDAKAIFEALVMDKDGALSSSDRSRCVRVYGPQGGAAASCWGWYHFLQRSVLRSLYLTNGSFFVIACGIKVMQKDPLDVPPSDIGSHLGRLLECADDVPCSSGCACRPLPVFKAQLLGSMADASMPFITLHDIAPATFKVMLRFMYTDACPADAELGDSPDEMLQHLLAAADRFALDRLKLLCASKLWDNVSLDTVATTLMCAETYNCPELKKKCIGFFGEGKNFKTKALLTDGFVQLAQQFPSILDELRDKVGA